MLPYWWKSYTFLLISLPEVCRVKEDDVLQLGNELSRQKMTRIEAPFSFCARHISKRLMKRTSKSERISQEQWMDTGSVILVTIRSVHFCWSCRNTGIFRTMTNAGFKLIKQKCIPKWHQCFVKNGEPYLSKTQNLYSLGSMILIKFDRHVVQNTS